MRARLFFELRPTRFAVPVELSVEARSYCDFLALENSVEFPRRLGGRSSAKVANCDERVD